VAYLDNAATTPLRAEALEAMLPFLTEHYGNPSGSHAVARRAKQALEDARETVAAGIGCGPGEVVFTGGGTEADNLAILGTVARRGGGRVIGTAVEHHAVLHAVAALGGVAIGVDADGRINLDELAGALSDDVSLVSVMLANNEVGTMQPMHDVVALVREHAPRAAVHTDAVQAFPWVDVASDAAGADLVAISAHKFGGPKGVGALAVRSSVKVHAIVHGGGQERELRSGTHNVAGIVGMAAAMAATVADRDAVVARARRLRDRLADGLLAAVPGAVETGDRAQKIAGNCHIRFPGCESEALLFLLDEAGVCASAGSACASGAIEPSHVLTAMGIHRDEALTSLRLSIGSTTVDADIDLALKAVVDAVGRLRDVGGRAR
jgi:cysteine desulfurase